MSARHANSLLDKAMKVLSFLAKTLSNRALAIVGLSSTPRAEAIAVAQRTISISSTKLYVT